jgi:3-ketosteroid 9alpha-monooxygenase subunit A
MHGWYQVAFERDVMAELTPARIGGRSIVLVRADGALRAFDAVCPHRGAHLAYGGRLADGAIVCPFHGYAIRLGSDRLGSLCVPEYAVLTVAGMVFVRRSAAHDNGWAAYVTALARDHHVVNGFEMSVRAPMQTVIENAFDQRHFHAVHGVRTDDFSVHAHEHGALVVESTFHVPSGDPRGGAEAFVSAAYRAFVVSPGLVSVELRGATPYTVITGATETAPGECVVRLTLAFPRAGSPSPPPARLYEPLLAHSRRGLDEDRIIWEHLSTPSAPRWMPADEPSLAFFAFCDAHRDD